MAPYLNNLLEDQKAHVLRLHADGLVAAKHEITYAKHALETAAKTPTTVIALRHHLWLHSTNFVFDTRVPIEDLPFDGAGLCHYTTDTMLQVVDQSIKTSRTLSVSSAASSQISCNPPSVLDQVFI